MKQILIASLTLVLLSACGSDDKNRAPTTAGASITLNEDSAASQVSVTATDPDGDALILALATAPTKGTAVVGSAPLSFLYTPGANQNGADQFTYTVTDPDGLSASGTVTIVLTAQPDAPTALAATISTQEDVAGQVTVTAADADGDALTLAITTTPTLGVVAVDTTNPFTFTYTPAPDANGTDSFAYRVADPSGLAATATVAVTIAARPDAPALVNAAIVTDEDVIGSVTVPALDVDGDTMTASVATAPAHGSVAITGTNPFTLSYTPAANANGPDSFTYRVTDSTGLAATATVSVSVAAQPDAPVIQAFTVQTTEEVAASGSVMASDADGDTVTLTVTTPAAHGTVQLTDHAYLYTPDTDYFGADTFTLTASDGTLTSMQAIPVAISGINDAPVAADDAETVVAGAPTLVDVAANDVDVDGDVLELEVVTQPLGAVAAVVGDQIRITPDSGFAGPASFEYRIRDAAGVADTARVRLVVGSASPLYWIAGTPRRIWRNDFLSDAQMLDTPVPPGETLERFTTSANGAVMVYVTSIHVSGSPVRHRLWARNLDDLAAAVFEITTDSNYFTNYLRLSSDGAVVVFNDRYASLSAPTISREVEPGALMIGPRAFTRDGQRLFYSVLQSGGGWINKRADVSVNGILANRLQMTGTYPAAQGVGADFVLSPDETRIVSIARLIVGPPVSGLTQQAYVTTADGSQDDTRLHPPFSSNLDHADLPLVTPDGRHAFYIATLNGVTSAVSTDLQAPGTVVALGSAFSTGGSNMRAAADSQTVFFTGPGPNLINWWSGRIGQAGSATSFQPLGGSLPAPRVVEVARDGTAVVFDSGAGIYGVLGGQFVTATLLHQRAVSSRPNIRYSPDSSTVAVANEVEGGGVILNPKEPSWSEQFSGAACLAYAGEDCLL